MMEGGAEGVVPRNSPLGPAPGEPGQSSPQTALTGGVSRLPPLLGSSPEAHRLYQRELTAHFLSVCYPRGAALRGALGLAPRRVLALLSATTSLSS